MISLLALVLAASASVQAKGSELVVTYRGHSTHYALKHPSLKTFRAHRVTEASVEGFNEKDGTAWVLVNASGPSRSAEGAMKQCGAGTERVKILFAVNPRGEVKKPTVFVTESCWSSAESLELPVDAPEHAVGLVLSVEGPDNVAVQHYLVFDLLEPERGVQRVKKVP